MKFVEVDKEYFATDDDRLVDGSHPLRRRFLGRPGTPVPEHLAKHYGLDKGPRDHDDVPVPDYALPTGATLSGGLADRSAALHVAAVPAPTEPAPYIPTPEEIQAEIARQVDEKVATAIAAALAKIAPAKGGPAKDESSKPAGEGGK